MATTSGSSGYFPLDFHKDTLSGDGRNSRQRRVVIGYLIASAGGDLKERTKDEGEVTRVTKLPSVRNYSTKS
jgi:hypothetical protein